MPRQLLLRIPALVVLGLGLIPARVRAEAAPIQIDGFFPEWTGPVELTDPAGDGGSSGIDIRDLDIANDGEFLFLRFQLTAEIGLQATNNLVLYIDTDNNAVTGTPVNGIGAELKWQFGPKTGSFFHGSTTSIKQNDIQLRQLPSVTATQFEVAIGRSVVIAGLPLFSGNNIRIFLRDEGSGGDWAPNSGQTLSYAFDATQVPAPSITPLSRQNASDTRLVAWNVVNLPSCRFCAGWNSAVTPSADRVFSALNPEVISLEEVYSPITASDAATLMESFLPSGAGEAWYAAESNDVKIVTRFPILQSWAIDGNSGVLLDSSPKLGHDMLVVGVHLPCCTDDSGRQQEADHIMSFFREAKTPGGAFTVADSTILVLMGDTNFVGFSQQVRTVLNGDIVDNATYGPDFAPDWDGTSLTDVLSRQTEKRQSYSWRSNPSTFAPGRLDYVIYSDAVVDLGNHFLLYSPEMSAAQRTLYGIQANDVTTVSDHLPHIADLIQKVPTDVAAAGGRGHGTQLTAVSPARGSASIVLTLERASRVRVDVYDVRGTYIAAVRGEDAGELAPGPHTLVWNGRTAGGQRAPSGTYIVRLTAHAGGVATATSSKLVLMH